MTHLVKQLRGSRPAWGDGAGCWWWSPWRRPGIRLRRSPDSGRARLRRCRGWTSIACSPTGCVASARATWSWRPDRFCQPPDDGGRCWVCIGWRLRGCATHCTRASRGSPTGSGPWSPGIATGTAATPCCRSRAPFLAFWRAPKKSLKDWKNSKHCHYFSRLALFSASLVFYVILFSFGYNKVYIIFLLLLRAGSLLLSWPCNGICCCYTHTHSRADENLRNQKGIFVFISFGEICNLHCFVFFVSWLSDFLACRFMFLCTPKFVAFCFLLYVHTHTRARQITTVCMFRVCVSGFVFFRCASLKQQQQFGIEWKNVRWTCHRVTKTSKNRWIFPKQIGNYFYQISIFWVDVFFEWKASTHKQRG